MEKINLSGKWNLIYVKNKIYTRDGETSSIEELKRRGYERIDATVPGNLEIDLERAGKIDDPFFGANHAKRDTEYLHAFYYRSFEYSGNMREPTLELEGIDTIAEIYVNGMLVGEVDNMLIGHSLDVSGALKTGENEIVVHIRPAVIEARKYPLTSNESGQTYNLESLHIRKAPHMYGWDIMPRIVSLGIWRPVSIVDKKPEYITEFYCYTSKCNEKEAHLRFNLTAKIENDECTDYTVRVRGVSGDSEFYFEKPLYHTSTEGDFAVDSPKLWWPRFYGEQNLYDLEVSLVYLGEVVDVYKTTLGIRTVSLDRTSFIDECDKGDFCYRVNGKRVFLMGTNWVPVDALHSRDAERIPGILPMIKDINCNVIRLWGGNVYENDMLYDFCDREGILIWQDFIMGCGVYPLDDGFMKKLGYEIAYAVKRLRQHPSILVWAGDNENDIALTWRGLAKRDPNGNTITRELIPHILKMHDYTRPYLPSSPYIDKAAYKMGRPLPEDHLWGPRDYFKGKFYRNSVSCFASETGYHACNSPDSIKKFIPKEYVWTAENSESWRGIDNDMWRYHSSSPEPDSNYTYRIKLMAKQVNVLFGDTVPNTLSDFAKASQISQAEANKYFIERFRVTKWRRTGIIWWNLIDGWSQFSDAVVDYYGVKKLAYGYIKRSQNPVLLAFDEPVEEEIELCAVNEFSTDKPLKYRVTDLTDETIVLEGEVTAVAEASTRVAKLPVKDGEKHFLYIEWELDGEKYSNHYVTNIRDLNYSEYISYIERVGYATFDGFSSERDIQ